MPSSAAKVYETSDNRKGRDSETAAERHSGMGRDREAETNTHRRRERQGDRDKDRGGLRKDR